MTKNPRDPREWLNPEIQADSDGYVAAQQAYADDLAAAEQKQRDDDEFERFKEWFVEDGGDPSDARAEWLARRRTHAADAAVSAERAARESDRAHVRSRL